MTLFIRHCSSYTLELGFLSLTLALALALALGRGRGLGITGPRRPLHSRLHMSRCRVGLE
jgi:hypothetical protein